MLRKEQEEKRALQVAYSKLKEAYDELEAESGKGAKPIATAVKDAVRNHYNNLPPSSQYILEKPLKSAENQRTPTTAIYASTLNDNITRRKLA
ncbi:hypothetical protein G6F29_014333 [Rhizopus arrhizus]|nr:hypothetical protein G6F29_014333 [Rhizopus arrhizus]KAG0971427.1 hypothetical protein G6F28_014295 [Rhizopus arrhizus]KAG1050458.1 hypothetical protein G6F41_014338 [Rhizopus arrhizus]